MWLPQNEESQKYQVVCYIRHKLVEHYCRVFKFIYSLPWIPVSFYHLFALIVGEKFRACDRILVRYHPKSLAKTPEHGEKEQDRQADHGDECEWYFSWSMYFSEFVLAVHKEHSEKGEVCFPQYLDKKE